MNSLSNILLRFDHIVLYADDAERSLAFYNLLPGISVSREKGRGIVRLGRQKINIHQWPSNLTPLALNPVIGRQAFCLIAADSDGKLGKILKAKGIKIFHDSCGEGSPSCPDCRDFYIEDLDGNKIWIKTADDIPGDALTGIFSLSLLVSDIDASIQFYQGILGMDCRSLPDGSICKFGNCRLRLTTQSNLLAKGNGDFCLLTDARIEDIPGQLPQNLLVPGFGIVPRTGAMGAIRSVYLRDPDGNLVEIAEPLDSAAIMFQDESAS